MKKCEKCQKEYEDFLEDCPFCNSESVADTIETNEEDKSFDKLQSNTNNERNYQPEENEIENHPKMFCKYCGNEIVTDSDYCNRCGRDIYDKDKRHCTKCGNILEPKQTFCDKCGQKASIIKLPSKIKNVKEHFSKKKMVVSIMVAVFAIALVVTGIKVIPNFFVKYDTYMAEGNYEKAYDKAGDEEKKLVLKENIAAVVSSLDKESLYDSNSFVLREIYIDETMKSVVIKEQGNNKVGGTISGYTWYKWNDEKSEFNSFGSCSDFDTEKINSWDDEDEKLEKALDITVKFFIKEAIGRKEWKMDSATVSRINDLNKSGKLGDVKLLNQAKEIVEKDDSSKS